MRFSYSWRSWSDRRKSWRRSSGIRVAAWGRCNTIGDDIGTNSSVIGWFAFNLEPPFWQQSNLLAKTKVLSIFGSWKRRFDPLAGALQVQLNDNPNSSGPALLNLVERVFLFLPSPELFVLSPEQHTEFLPSARGSWLGTRLPECLSGCDNRRVLHDEIQNRKRLQDPFG